MLADENNPGFKKVNKDMADHNMPTSLYLCDMLQCPKCSYPQCKFTTNLFHKKNVEDKHYYTDMIDWLANLSDEIVNLNTIDENLRDEIAEAMLTARNTLIYYIYFYDRWYNDRPGYVYDKEKGLKTDEKCQECKKDWTKCSRCPVMMKWVKEHKDGGAE